MRLRVFGNNSDDKGTQLEQLTCRLLGKLGYKQISANVVGSGGSEVDVRAEFPISPLHTGGPLHIVAECKAHDSPINLPDWLKFLGKIYSEAARRPSQVRGVLIALSGANGNVMGAIADLRIVDTTVDLITGERLGELVVEEFALPGVEQALNHVSQLTKDSVIEISLGYYAGQSFWIVEFADSSYAALCGSSMTDVAPENLRSVLGVYFKASSFRDLRHEVEAQRILETAKKYVLGRALDGLGFAAARKELCSEPALGITDANIGDAIKALAECDLVEADPEKIAIKEINTDLNRRVAIIRTLIEEHLLTSLPGARGWLELIDEPLLEYLLSVQGNLTMPPEFRPECIQLLKWSPTALNWALIPDPMLVVHRNAEVPLPNLSELDDIRYFRLQLLRFAVADFQNPLLAASYFEKFGLRELEFGRHATFKSGEKVVLSIDIHERQGIGRLAPELGGGVIRVWMTEGAPEPWNVAAAIRLSQTATRLSPGDDAAGS